jgi:hypothetical protein
MANEKFEWLSKIKAVEREHASIRFATDHLLKSLEDGTKDLERDLKRLDINRASQSLEGTYIVRLFSEFEVALKQYLRTSGTKVPKDAKPLINRIASRVKFSGPILDNAHLVRLYRNRLIHDRPAESGSLTIRTVTSYLCTFMSRLPADW